MADSQPVNDIEVIVRFTIQGWMFSEADEAECGMNLAEQVRDALKDDGLFGICEDEYEVVSVQRR